MTYALFGPLSVLGEVGVDQLARLSGPVLDPTGTPVRNPDDGPQSTPSALREVAAGSVGSLDDVGRSVFHSRGFDVTLSITDSRFVVAASSGPAGQWAGEVRYRWVSNLQVRPPAGRKDPGSIRVLFLDPTEAENVAGRQYVDLTPPRRGVPAELAWNLIQHIANDRYRWLTTDPDAHQQVDALIRAGERSSGWYVIPGPSVWVDADRRGPVWPVDQGGPPELFDPDTVSIARPESGADPGTEPVAAVGLLNPWAPASAVTPDASGLPSSPVGVEAGRLISAVPGVARRTAPAGYLVEFDSGDPVVIESPTLFGRHPAPAPGELAELHPVLDSTFSYSKTHLLLVPTPDGITVTDRHSTNGVLIDRAGRLTPCPPGVPQLLELPAMLRSGSRWLTVNSAVAR